MQNESLVKPWASAVENKPHHGRTQRHKASSIRKVTEHIQSHVQEPWVLGWDGMVPSYWGLWIIDLWNMHACMLMLIFKNYPVEKNKFRSNHHNWLPKIIQIIQNPDSTINRICTQLSLIWHAFRRLLGFLLRLIWPIVNRSCETNWKYVLHA